MYQVKFIQLADQIKFHRIRKHLTQKQLAIKLGVHESSISKWESAMVFPRIDSIVRMAKIFEVNFSDLFSNCYYNKMK